MGQRGKQPQTDEMKNRKGNPGRRKPKQTPGRPMALNKLPTAPKHIQRIAGSEWRRIGQKYVDQGKLTDNNLKALELYCMNYSIVRKQMLTLEKEGEVITSGQGGHRMPHPAVGVMNKAQKEMRDWLKVIETTVAQIPEKEKSALEKFRERKQGIVRVK